MNLRCGKYKNTYGTNPKNKCYKSIKIIFTQKEYKNWCWKHENVINKLSRPSIDRKNSTKNYTFNNIQIIELTENIRKKKFGSQYVNGTLSNKKRGVSKQGKKWQAKITYNYKCTHLGLFLKKKDAYNAFYNEYYRLYKKYPW